MNNEILMNFSNQVGFCRDKDDWSDDGYFNYKMLKSELKWTESECRMNVNWMFDNGWVEKSSSNVYPYKTTNKFKDDERYW